MHAFHRGRKFEKHGHPRLERLGSCGPLLGDPRPVVLRPPLGVLVREDVGQACIILGRVTSMKCIERERSVGWGLVAGHIRWAGRMGCVGRRVPERGRHESSEAAMNRHGVVRGDGVEVLVCALELDQPREEVARNDGRERNRVFIQHSLPVKRVWCLLDGGRSDDGGRGVWGAE
jgi:hypothetical protein